MKVKVDCRVLNRVSLLFVSLHDLERGALEIRTGFSFKPVTAVLNIIIEFDLRDI